MKPVDVFDIIADYRPIGTGLLGRHETWTFYEHKLLKTKLLGAFFNQENFFDNPDNVKKILDKIYILSPIDYDIGKVIEFNGQGRIGYLVYLNEKVTKKPAVGFKVNKPVGFKLAKKSG